VIRLVAAGCGRVFERFHMPALRSLPQWSLVGAADNNPDRLAWMAAQAPAVVTDGELDPLLFRLRPDAVLITTPPQSHATLGAAALRAGAHILTEKPMVEQRSEAELLLELAEQYGRQIWVGFNRRFRSAYVELRGRLARLPQESIRAVRFQLRSDPHGWGSVSGHLLQENAAEALLGDIASHQLDLVPWLLDRNPSRLRAQHVEGRGPGISIEIQLQFSEGLMATCVAAHAPGYSERLEVDLESGTWLAGPGGLIRNGMMPTAVGWGRLSLGAHSRAAARKLLRRPGETLETFRDQWATWAGRIEGHSTGPRAPEVLPADGAAGSRCVTLVDACRRSLALGGAWTQINQSAS
jgi:predicted dehydrogenase